MPSGRDAPAGKAGWVVWSVDRETLEAVVVGTFEDHGAALSCLLDLDAGPTGADQHLVLAPSGELAHRIAGQGAGGRVQRVGDASAWAVCQHLCADGRQRVRA